LGGLLFGLLGLRPDPVVPETRLDGDPIVMIVVSGLRADHTALGSAPADPSATPNLDAFGRTALVFEQAHATSNWAVPSLASTLTGRLPYRHRAGHHDGGRQRHTALSASVVTLPALLHRSGWSTAAFVGDPRLRLYGLDRGFDQWEEAPERGAVPTLWPVLEATGISPAPWPRIATAEQVTDRALAWLDRQPDEGWVLLVHYADTGVDQLDGSYGERLVEVDHQIGRLVDALPGDAWVVVAGDHGRGLGEVRPDMLRTATGVPDGHHVYEELLHVPLALRLPTLFPGRVKEPVSLVDVAPTLLAALGHAPLPRPD
ncbi:MAG: sulfatase, partial [Myxococcota bacterium]